MSPGLPQTGDAANTGDTVVIGAGISGLTAAFHLARGGRRVTVVEASPRVGGTLSTWTGDSGWRFELGPNTVLESHESVTRLIQEAGLDGEKLTASPTGRRRYLWKDGRLQPLPTGPGAFLKTKLFPLSAKLRLLREPWIGRSPESAEETVADFVRRRLGPAFLDDAVGPFVSGVYAGDPERLSIRHAIPRISALEREHGSLIRGAFARRKGSGPRPGGAMISFREGMEQLPRALAEAIGDVRTGVACRRIVRTETGFRIETDAGDTGTLTAREVILAVPADEAARLLDEATDGRSRALAEIPYAPVVLVSTGWRRQDVAHPLDGFGFLASRKEGLSVLGVLFPSQIFPGRAPEGHVGLTAFLGGRTQPEILDWTDERLVSAVLKELRETLGAGIAAGQPVVQIIRRWPRAIPQYEVGHGRFVDLAARIEADLPGLRIGGNFLNGISVPECIRNATGLVDRMLQGRMLQG